MTAYAELYLGQGSTFNNVINLTDDITNAYINVSGYTVKSQMRRSYYSANASANITCAVTDAANGEITMSMTSSNTANLKAGKYLYDVEVTDGVGKVSYILEGVITVTPRITQN